MNNKITVAVVALLKESQVTYKITPILNSEMVDEVILFRKNNYNNRLPKLRQYVLPKFMSYKPFYWTLTPFYIAYKLRKQKVDLLITYRFMPHTFYTFIVSRLLNKPFIYSQIDFDVVTLFETRLGKYFVRYILSRAVQINVPGQVSKTYWSKYLLSKINILHSTINTDSFVPVERKAIYDLIYVGVLSELKQVHLLILMINKLRYLGLDAKLAIVGNGKCLESLKQLTVKLKLEKLVTFLGFQIITPELLCSAKVFTMASNSEGLPCALMEAMACELVCIVPNVGNMSEVIIEGETGYFYKSYNPDDMAEQCFKLLSEYNQLELIRKNARKMIVENHSFLSATNKWDQIFRETVVDE